MEQIQEMLDNIPYELEKMKSKLREYKKALNAAKKWWSECAEYDGGKLTGSVVLINDVKCLCVRAHIRAFPSFVVEFDFRPCKHSEDAGSGPGNTHTIEF